ncbi:MAG: bifunctional UDP-N-acetylglucosamine diphosphorylase/glucosamine-1-phosphate N-acetyltransferase GlmU [Tepidiformaceae bacterium]
MSGSRTGVVVLAAGRGTRMRSALPKVLQPVCGTPMVAHVIEAARGLQPRRIAVVVGYGAEAVRREAAGDGVVFVEQPELLGTADAVRRCEDVLAGCDTVVVLNGDVPLVTTVLLERLAAAGSPISFVSCRVEEAGRLGRVARAALGGVTGIIEAADSDGLDGPAEINAGQHRPNAAWRWKRIGEVPASASGERYLTHLVAMAAAEGHQMSTVEGSPEEALGVDDRVQLAEAERLMRARILREHMEAGVTIADPATTYIDRRVRLAGDVTVLPNCYLYGETSVASQAVIGPGTTLRNVRIGASRVQASVVEDSSIGDGTSVGPFAHVRGGAEIGDDCVIGNYAEVKNSKLGNGVKMHHFSYLGDATVGERANIAAGMVTCNFDGVTKHRTVIGAGAFIGCDTMLVAPVTIGDGAVTGAGSVVREDVPPGAKVAGVPARIIGRAGHEE